MALVPGEFVVEKGINTSKCPAVELGCSHYGSSIRIDRFLTNVGFKLDFDFSLVGFALSKEQIRKLSDAMASVASSILHSHEADLCEESFYQGSLFGSLA